MRHRLVLLRIVLGRSLLVRVIVWLLVLRGHVLLRCMVMHRCAVPIATPFASIATPFASIVTPFASIATVPLWLWVSAVCTDRRAVDGMLQSTHEVSCVEPKRMMLPSDTELASDTECQIQSVRYRFRPEFGYKTRYRWVRYASELSRALFTAELSWKEIKQMPLCGLLVS